jgi:hypothetical protein
MKRELPRHYWVKDVHSDDPFYKQAMFIAERVDGYWLFGDKGIETGEVEITEGPLRVPEEMWKEG